MNRLLNGYGYLFPRPARHTRRAGRHGGAGLSRTTGNRGVAAVIRTHGLTRRYGRLTAVRDLNLEVPAGAIFGFIGPNGAGKTTTLRMLATLLTPTAGTFTIDGLDPERDLAGVRRRIGYLADLFGLYNDLKVWEYLDYFCRAYEVADPRQRTEEMLHLVQLTHKKDAMVGALSRGMKQRLGLARALVAEPKVLLLDEPASGLDPMARIALRDLLRQLRDQGATIVVSSHILTELSDFCDSVGLMEKGRLIVSGPIQEILARTRTHLRLVLEVLGPPERAAEVLRGLPAVVDLKIAGQTVELGFTGAREELPPLHKKLVEAGVPVVAFFPRPENLEDLFLRLSTGATN
jgi:ABC-2 type transport system ATP-binding protein